MKTNYQLELGSDADPDPKRSKVASMSFEDTQTAFMGKTTGQLRNSRWLFQTFTWSFLRKIGPGLARLAVTFGCKNLVKKTIFQQFCGGEDIDGCEDAITELAKFGVGTILDYSVEGGNSERQFDNCMEEIIRTVEFAKGRKEVPFTVFKITGLAKKSLLQKFGAKSVLTSDEILEFHKVRGRVYKICKAAELADVRVLIDAEESWFQTAIDSLAEEMMDQFNVKKAIVYTTIQMYRRDRLGYLMNLVSNKSGFLGFKIVRGAYIEKERERALKMGYPDPIHMSKSNCDEDFYRALDLCFSSIDRTAVCIGSHNTESCEYAIQLIDKMGLDRNDNRVYFSQLMGMGDVISFVLAQAGYNVAKYMPYGPIMAVLPYLSRRADENSASRGMTGRELQLIKSELRRRRRIKFKRKSD